MTPQQYWRGPVADPSWQYTEGSGFSAPMIWQGQHGDTAPATDMNGPCMTTDVGCPPPNWAPPPRVPLQYQDNAADMIAQAGLTLAQVFTGPTTVPLADGYPWQIARQFDPGFNEHALGYGIDPAKRSIYVDLHNAGVPDIQIAQYALNAYHIDPGVGGAGKIYNWAAAYAEVLNQAAHDYPDLANQLTTQYLTAANYSSGQAYANSRAAQISQIDNTPFDHFMQNYAPYIFAAAFAAMAVAGAAAAGAATTTETTATAGATSGIDAATAADIGTGWESAAATSSLQNAALAAAGGDASAAASLTAAVGADQAAAMIADASSLLSGTATAGAATATAINPTVSATSAAPAGAATPGESAASLLSEAKSVAGTASTLYSYGQKLAAILSGKPPPTAPTAIQPVQAGLAQPSGIANNFPLILGGAALLAIVVKRKGKRIIH